MKKLNLIPTVLAAVLISTSAFATIPNFEFWDYDNDPLEELLAMEAIPFIETVTPVVVSSLTIEAVAVKDNFLKLSLPYSENEVIGVVIYDRKGNVVFNEKGEYRILKSVLLADTGDNEYVIKAYKDNAIHQVKLKVIHK